MAKTPFDFGAKGDGLSNDHDALQAWLNAGGGEIPAGTFVFDGGLRMPDGCQITRWQGVLAYREGWISGYAVSATDWAKPSKGILIDASAGGKLVYFQNRNLKPRKGFGIIFDGAKLIKLRVEAGLSNPEVKGAIDLFSYEFRDGVNNTLTGCTGDMVTGRQGCDLFHFSRNSKGNRLNGCGGRSGDDTISFTAETPSWGPVTIADNHVNGGKYVTIGHSVIKLLSSVNNGSSITGIQISGVEGHVLRDGSNPGQPIIVQTQPKDKVDFPLLSGCTLSAT